MTPSISDEANLPGPEDRQIIAPITDANPKNSEGSAIALTDGSILLCWTAFLDEALMPPEERPEPSPLRRSATSDDGYARIVGSLSRDGGRTWSTPEVYVDDRDARVNTMSPSLGRLRDGRLFIAYSWRSGGNHADNYGPTARRFRVSTDEGATWSDPIRITPDDGTYHTGCHDRAWTLPSGRVLVQCHTNRLREGASTEGRFEEGAFRYQKDVYIARSDDDGQTWSHSNRLTIPDGPGLNESCLVRRSDGSLLMVLRAWNGMSCFSESDDDGATWSEPRPSGLTSPDAPSFLTRIPESDDLLMVWNPNPNLQHSHELQIPAGEKGESARTVRARKHAVSRCPLATAISRNGGRSWENVKLLESDINYEWAYPGVLFHEGHALVHYFRSPALGKGRELVLRRIPVAWFYSNAVGA